MHRTPSCCGESLDEVLNGFVREIWPRLFVAFNRADGSRDGGNFRKADRGQQLGAIGTDEKRVSGTGRRLTA